MMLNPPNRRRRPRAALALAPLVLACLAGCQPQHTDYSAFLREPRPVVTTTEYRLAPPDVVTLNSKTIKEIQGHQEQIRPDGKLTLPLVGSVYVTGMSCEEAAAAVAAKYREYYKGDLDAHLRVVAYNSKKIYVFGQVSRPGPYEYNGTNTVLRTMAFAQPTFLADPASIQVLRPSGQGQMIKRMTIDLDKMVKEGDTALNAVLEEGDILYVPANPLASVGLALQQLLLPIQPAVSAVSGPSSTYSTMTGQIVLP